MPTKRPKNPRQKITAEVLNKYTAEQLEKYIEQMGKRANRHLAALEKAESEKGSKAYKYIQSLAHDNKYATHTERPRFLTTTAGDKSFQEMKSHAAEIQRFFQARTHTVHGVERAYKKTYDTYIHRKALQSVESEKGLGNATKAEVMKAESELRKKISKEQFNQAWGAFNASQYEKAKQMSDIVADLIEEGYSGEDIGRAIDEYGTERAENEYMQLIDADFVMEDNPFEQKGAFD
jgi:hypothetical protein